MTFLKKPHLLLLSSSILLALIGCQPKVTTATIDFQFSETDSITMESEEFMLQKVSSAFIIFDDSGRTGNGMFLSKKNYEELRDELNAGELPENLSKVEDGEIDGREYVIYSNVFDDLTEYNCIGWIKGTEYAYLISTDNIDTVRAINSNVRFVCTILESTGDAQEK